MPLPDPVDRIPNRLAQDSLEFTRAEKTSIRRQWESAEARLKVGLATITDVHDAKAWEEAGLQLGQIAGQKPQVRRARKSVANFKLREGMPIGISVTLRGDRMWEFFDRLISVSIPRIRDFRGLNPRSFDGRGNYTFGVTEQLIFPEIDFDKVTKVRGMDITICTTAKDDEGGRALLDAFGFPFRRAQTQAGV